jgi:hypothetical protein
MFFVNLYFGLKLFVAALAVLVMLIVFGAVTYLNLKELLKQRRCKHTAGVNETRSCAAICKGCGKNLGFIGTDENKIRRRQ